MTNLQRAEIKINVMIDALEEHGEIIAGSKNMIAWLKELREVIKPETEKCDFCMGDKIIQCEEGSPNAEAEVYINPGYMNFIITENADDPQEQTETEFTFKIDNCPLCGRKF